MVDDHGQGNALKTTTIVRQPFAQRLRSLILLYLVKAGHSAFQPRPLLKHFDAVILSLTRISFERFEVWGAITQFRANPIRCEAYTQEPRLPALPTSLAIAQAKYQLNADLTSGTDAYQVHTEGWDNTVRTQCS